MKETEAETNKKKRTHVKNRLRQELIKEVISKFKVMGEFNVTMSTIHNRIKSINLTVFHPGTKSPVLEIEMLLMVTIVTAWNFQCPISAGQCLLWTNDIIKGTPAVMEVSVWKNKHSCYNQRTGIFLGGTGGWDSRINTHNC